MAFVLDASVAMNWCFTDELNPYSQGVLDYLRRSHAVVPTIWPLEVRNVLLTSERRSRITPAGSDEFLVTLGGLDIRVQAEQPGLHNGSVLALARAYRLTIYDATASRQGLPLATRDKDLLSAAPLAGVPIFSPAFQQHMNPFQR